MVLIRTRLKSLLHVFKAVKKKNKVKLALKSCMDENLKQLLYNGKIVLKNIISKDVIEKLNSDYAIGPENFKVAGSNISFAIFNKELFDIVQNPYLKELIGNYFFSVYGKKPVMQCIPYLLIVKPNIDQNEFEYGKNNIPGVWHTDYYSEFSVHIPLFPVSSKTTHTCYALKSHVSPKSMPQYGWPEATNETVKNWGFEIEHCYAENGDLLLFDVTGIHRAEILRKSFRAMIQLKYTTGNNMLNFNESTPKIRRGIKHYKKHCIKLWTIQNKIKSDLEFISKTNFPENIKIIPQSFNHCLRYSI